MTLRSSLCFAAVASVAVCGALAFTHDGGHGGGDHGRSARLTPPEGAPFPDARGEVVLNRAALLVKVERLAAGDYTVLLDDGTGTSAPIGTITVAAHDDDDDDDGAESGGGSAADEDDGDDEDDTRGILRLSGDQLPFGAQSPLDLGGRAISVNDADAKTVLSGTTPAAIPPEPERKNGRCPLSRPDPAVDADAEGVLKLESGGGRVVIKVHLRNLEPGKVYDVILTNPAPPGSSESLGKVTIGEGGNGQFKVDSDRGDAIPFGAGDLAALLGFGISVKDEAGAVVLVGTVCEAQVRPDHEDGDEDDDGPPGPVKPRCFSAVLTGGQEAPPVTTDATGVARFNITGRDGTVLRYEVKVEGLSGPVTAAHIHEGAVGVDGGVVHPLDAATLKGEIEITEEDRAKLAAGAYYVNVHTAANPDGEIRGQIGTCPPGDDDDGDDDDGDGDDDDGEDGDDDDADDDDGDDDDQEPPPPPPAAPLALVAGPAPSGAPAEEPMFLMIGEFDAPFLRGDTNADRSLNIADPVALLAFLYLGGEKPYCLDAADANDDGRLNVADPVALLTYLFLGAGEPSEPGTLIAGSDPSGDLLHCEEL